MSSSYPSDSEYFAEDEGDTLSLLDYYQQGSVGSASVNINSPALSTSPELNDDMPTAVYPLPNPLSRLLIPTNTSEFEASSLLVAPPSSASFVSSALSTDQVLDFLDIKPPEDKLIKFLMTLQRIFNDICPADEIAEETRRIVDDIMQKSNKAIMERAAAHWAGYLFNVVIGEMQYSRIVALLAHDVLEGLPEGNAHWQFQNTLVNSVVDAFSESWLNVSAAHFLQDILLARDVVIAVRSTGFTRSCFSRRL